MEKLVNRLRDFAAELRKAEDALLVRDAAEAIEELSHENKSLAESVNEAAELLHKRGMLPKWIPVTERLPTVLARLAKAGGREWGNYVI